MPTADGVIACNSETRKFTATFMIDGAIYMLSGTFASTLPPFRTNKATIMYDEVSQLTSAVRAFTGQIGFSSMEIKLDNGVIVSGIFGAPVERGCLITGWASWILSWK
ncbi:hypothetical protein D9619_006891 [Psilocybe cf. subviscida]|uniref:Uncharacterized protein n=1 Tax=Psilocybe cf. subviscida TaxID=2480587 RepID=A0A8H5B629_9AGAR|nr:hypothetical protein D9619_006891 [Psilocybe cf. subviscida]